jgi:hypothetical protein
MHTNSNYKKLVVLAYEYIMANNCSMLFASRLYKIDVEEIRAYEDYVLSDEGLELQQAQSERAVA